MFVVLYFRCAYSCFSRRSNYSCVGFPRQRHSERVLLIEILKILLICARVEKQDLETVTGEMEGGISWPWGYLGSLGCTLPSAVRSSWELSYSQCSCSLSFLQGMGEVMGNLYNKCSSCNCSLNVLRGWHGFPFQEKILNNSSSCPPASAQATESAKSRRAKLVFDDR